MAGVWKAYQRCLQKYPLRTMSATTGTLMAAGDGIAQLVVERRSLAEYDTIRSARFLGFGCLIGGPLLRGWYITLDKVVKGATKSAAFKKMFLDQTLMAPFFLTNFLGIMGLMRGESVTEIKEKYQRDFVPILISNYKLWPAVQIVNFYLVPLQHRILVVNMVALLWNTYLAWRSEMVSDETTEPQQA